MTQQQLSLTLNPSVKEKDELRLSRQAMEMYELFLARDRMGLLVSTNDLDAIGDQYQARLYEVRRALISKGLCIDLVKKGEGGVNYYKLVNLEQSTFFSKRKNYL